MPVLINKETGLAENVANPGNGYAVPMYDSEGNPYQAELNEVQQLVKQGYSLPTPQESQQALRNASLSGTKQSIAAGLEGAASTATLGLSTALETSLGVPAEDILQRKEMHPVAHTVGELAGLFGTPGGEAISGAGKAAETFLAPKLAQSFVGRIGTPAAKLAIENMVFQGQDEASKYFMGDPNQSMETAAADVGLAGLIGGGIGGGIGSVSEAWKAFRGPRLASSLDGISKRAGGMSDDMMNATKIDIPDDLRPVLQGNPAAADALAKLQDSDGYIAGNVQEKVQELKNSANDALVTAMGKSPEDASNISDYEVGKQAQKSLVDSIKEQTGPTAESYAKIEGKFKEAPVLPEHQAVIADDIAKMATDQGYHKITGSEGADLVNRVLKDLPKQETAQDLRNYASVLTKENKFGSKGFDAAKRISSILDKGRDAAIEAAIGTKSPELMGEFKTTQASYRNFKDLAGELNDRLRAGITRFDGPSGVISKIRNMAPEDVLNRLSPKGDVNMQQMLEEKFPQVSEMMKQVEVDKILKSSAGKEGQIDTTKLFRNLGKLQPEMKSFLFKPEMQQQLEAIEKMLSHIPKKGYSGTQPGLWGLLKKMPPSAVGVGAMVMGHANPATYLLGHLAGLVGREGPNAVRLATLKFLSSPEAISPAGFKAATQTAGAVLRGESKLNSSIKSIFSSGAKVIQFPSEKSRAILDTQVQKVASNQDDLTSAGGDTGHYLPDHGAAIGLIAARNLRYLGTLVPHPTSTGPLSKPEPANQVAKSNYNRALDIAQSPLVITKFIKDGTLTNEDMAHLKTMYPALYVRMQDKIVKQVVDQKHEESHIPYDTQMSLSRFLGQPLDSSMSSQSIMSTQFVTPSKQQAQQANSQPMSRTSTKLQKLPAADATPGQARQMQKSQGR